MRIRWTLRAELDLLIVIFYVFYFYKHTHTFARSVCLCTSWGGSVVYGAILAQITCQKIGIQADIHIEG